MPALVVGGGRYQMYEEGVALPPSASGGVSVVPCRIWHAGRDLFVPGVPLERWARCVEGQE